MIRQLWVRVTASCGRRHTRPTGFQSVPGRGRILVRGAAAGASVSV